MSYLLSITFTLVQNTLNLHMNKDKIELRSRMVLFNKLIQEIIKLRPLSPIGFHSHLLDVATK